eukprot:3445851-Prymnesium_polylepis.1
MQPRRVLGFGCWIPPTLLRAEGWRDPETRLLDIYSACATELSQACGTLSVVWGSGGIDGMFALA